MTPVRTGLAAVVVVVFALAIAGVGMGDAPKNDPAPTGAALTASKAAIAGGDEQVKEGAKEFEQEHCDSCHAIAATGAKGQIGPRMDAQGDEGLDDIAENIEKPRKDIKDGYEANLMPTDYSKRMTPDEIAAVAKFIKAASQTGEEKKGEEEGG